VRCSPARAALHTVIRCNVGDPSTWMFMKRFIPSGVAALPVMLFLLAQPASAQQQQQSGQRSLVERAGEARSKGSTDAPVLVFEISDFQCPFCRQFALDVFPHIDSAYIRTDRVQWVFVSLPVPSHANAWVAHEAAACAGGVADRFWQMKERIFQQQGEWTAAADPGVHMARYARETGVPMDRVRSAGSRCVTAAAGRAFRIEGNRHTHIHCKQPADRDGREDVR
jgi:protein-disulfide isomerase